MKLDSCSILTSVSVRLVETGRFLGSCQRLEIWTERNQEHSYEGSGTGVTVQ